MRQSVTDDFKKRMLRRAWSSEEKGFDLSGDSRIWYRKGQEYYDNGLTEEDIADLNLHPLKRGAIWMGYNAAKLVEKGYQAAVRGSAYFQNEPHESII